MVQLEELLCVLLEVWTSISSIHIRKTRIQAPGDLMPSDDLCGSSVAKIYISDQADVRLCIIIILIIFQEPGS